MSPQQVVSTVFKRLKKEWNEAKARQALRELIQEKRNKNLSKTKNKMGYYQVWVDSESFAYSPDKPLSKPLLKAMFDQSYVSYKVQMNKQERKRHRERQKKI